MSVKGDRELLEAEVRYLRDRIAVMRAKLYGRGLGSSARLQDLERGLEQALRRLRERRQQQP